MNIENIKITELHLFRENPFKVRHDESFDSLIESISSDGIYEPLIVCPDKEDSGYILVSGQRRFEAAKTAGLETVPVVIHDMDRDKMIIAIVDNNICSRDILISEKAYAYKLKMEALSHQGASRQVGEKWSVTQISDNSNDSERQIHRYIRLTNLIPELLNLIDDRKIAFSVGVELSYLNQEKQYEILDLIEKLDCTPSYAQANKMHKDFVADTLTVEGMEELLSADKPNQREKVTFQVDALSKYFKKETTPKMIQEYILKLLEDDFKRKARYRNLDSR